MNTKQLLEVSQLTRLNLLLTNALVSVQTLTNEVATVEGANPVTQALVETNLSDLFKVLLPLEMEPFNRYGEQVDNEDYDSNVESLISKWHSLRGGVRQREILSLDAIIADKSSAPVFIDKESAEILYKINDARMSVYAVGWQFDHPPHIDYLSRVVSGLSALGSSGSLLENDGDTPKGMPELCFFGEPIYVVTTNPPSLDLPALDEGLAFKLVLTEDTPRLDGIKVGKVIYKEPTAGERVRRGIMQSTMVPRLSTARSILGLAGEESRHAKLSQDAEPPFGGMFVNFDFDKFNAETDRKVKFQLLTDFYKSAMNNFTESSSRTSFSEYEHKLHAKTIHRYFVELLAHEFIELHAVDLEFDPTNPFERAQSVPDYVTKSLEVSTDLLLETFMYNKSKVGMFSTMTDEMADFALKLYKQQGRPEFVISDAPNVHTLLYVSVADDCV